MNQAFTFPDAKAPSMVTIYSKFIPPSLNAAYRNAVATDNTKRRIKTARYRNWVQAFGYDVNLAMRGQQPITGPYGIKITIDKSTRHALSDIFNREKCVSDALQEFGVIKNDRFCEIGTICWGEANGGIRIDVWSTNPACSPPSRSNLGPAS